MAKKIIMIGLAASIIAMPLYWIEWTLLKINDKK